MIQQVLTAEQFLEQRPELPEAGQWAELVRGVPVLLEPPDLMHGTAVLNLSKALAEHFGGGAPGYACFDLGLKVQRAPDTVLFPAVSLFLEGERFAEADKEMTETVPQLVVEILSTTDRRRGAEEKVTLYHCWGVPEVWLVDCDSRVTFVCRPQVDRLRVSEMETLRGEPLLRGFSIPVADLFAEPEWYRGR